MRCAREQCCAVLCCTRERRLCAQLTRVCLLHAIVLCVCPRHLPVNRGSNNLHCLVIAVATVTCYLCVHCGPLEAEGMAAAPCGAPAPELPAERAGPSLVAQLKIRCNVFGLGIQHVAASVESHCSWRRLRERMRPDNGCSTPAAAFLAGSDCSIQGYNPEMISYCSQLFDVS